MKYTGLDRREPLVERSGRSLRSITITTALWVVLLATPFVWAKYVWQKARKDILQIEQRDIKNRGLSGDVGKYWEKPAVCDWTYVYHGPYYLK